MKNSFFKTYYSPNFGLLILRIGIGLAFVMHGKPKIFGGPELWEKIGGVMSDFGLDFGLVFWGFMAAIAEFAGGILLALGLFFRPACVLLFLTMLVASLKHISAGDDFKKYTHALELAILLFGLYFIGPGKFSLDTTFFVKKNKPNYY
ncbi:MAG: DoxX family protein [Cytophagaceae bacterium]|nr:DoxX family protein [Cytophagaceae bacterium]